MRIGLDGLPLAQPVTGVGGYTFELALALAGIDPEGHYRLISPKAFQPSILNARKPENIELVHTRPGLLRRRWWTIGLPSYLRHNPFDLFHGTNYEVPLRNSGPSIVTIHDLSLLLHSSTHEGRAVRRARLRLPLMARQATFIVTPSQQVRSEVCEHLRADAGRVFAIPLAPRSNVLTVPAPQLLETRRRLGITDDFLLYAGTIEPRKNLGILIEALEQVVRVTSLRPRLVLVGQMGWKSGSFAQQLRQSPVRDLVHLTGFLPDEDLSALYSTCTAFVYPSMYEGFGLPPLEAMACGAPVIATRIPSLTEAGESGARLVSPADVDALARAIAQLCNDESAQSSLRERGREYAARFSWKRTASETLDVYRHAISAFHNRRR